jgi:ketosteroid isomerase-like protein
VSQENVEVVKRANALLNRGAWDEMALLSDPDIVLRDLRNAADTQQALEGSQSVLALLAQWSEAFDDFGAEVIEYLDAHPYVVCDSRWYARGKRSQIPVDVHQTDVYELRDGKIISVTLGYANAADALEAVGLGK